MGALCSGGFYQDAASIYLKRIVIFFKLAILKYGKKNGALPPLYFYSFKEQLNLFNKGGSTIYANTFNNNLFFSRDNTSGVRNDNILVYDLSYYLEY